jgi:hypothetical protein
MDKIYVHIPDSVSAWTFSVDSKCGESISCSACEDGLLYVYKQFVVTTQFGTETGKELVAVFKDWIYWEKFRG